MSIHLFTLARPTWTLRIYFAPLMVIAGINTGEGEDCHYFELYLPTLCLAFRFKKPEPCLLPEGGVA